MTVMQTLTEELAAILSGNTIYMDHKSQWEYLLESYLGGDEYRQAGHLTRYQLETDAEYQARLRTTPLDNHCQSVVSVYLSFLFRQPPKRDFDNNTESFELEQFLRDADLDGRSMDHFMKDVALWGSVFGHCWVMVTKPNVGAVTRADELAQGVRPYVSLLTPLSVLDWQWTRSITGRYELSYLKYLEDVNGDVSTVKEWTTDVIRTRIVNTNTKVVEQDTVEPNGLGKIPAVVAYNGRSTVRGIGVSDIADIADQQRFIYNATSEVEQTIRMDSHPSLVKTPDTIAGSGSGAIIHMPENLDPGLKPYLLEHAGASVDAIYQAVNHAVSSIDKMANTGAVRATETRTLSGVAMETEFQLLNARLSEKADLLQLAEEQIWQLWFEYQGEQWMGNIEYPSSFNIRDTGKEIEQYKMAKDAATDPRVIKSIDMKILEWLGEEALEDVLEYEVEPFEVHTMQNPTTGEQVQVTTLEQHDRLSAEGYVELDD